MPESAEQSAWYPLLRTYERESAMISTFNLEKLSSLLQDFYTVTRIRITVFDENFNEIVSYPGQRLISAVWSGRTKRRRSAAPGAIRRPAAELPPCTTPTFTSATRD